MYSCSSGGANMSSARVGEGPNITLTTIKARVTGITTTLQLLTSGIGRKDGGRETGRPETFDKDVVAAFGGDTEKTLAQRVVRSLVSNA